MLADVQVQSDTEDTIVMVTAKERAGLLHLQFLSLVGVREVREKQALVCYPKRPVHPV